MKTEKNEKEVTEKEKPNKFITLKQLSVLSS